MDQIIYTPSKESVAMIATFKNLVTSLPKEIQTKKLIKDLKHHWQRQIEKLQEISEKAEKPFIALLPFTQVLEGYMAQSWIDDLAIKDQYPRIYTGWIILQKGKIRIADNLYQRGGEKL